MSDGRRSVDRSEAEVDGERKMMTSGDEIARRGCRCGDRTQRL